MIITIGVSVRSMDGQVSLYYEIIMLIIKG